jgi:hypothetical protein
VNNANLIAPAGDDGAALASGSTGMLVSLS